MTTTYPVPAPRPATRARRAGTAPVLAGVVGLMVVTGFAMLAVVPLGLLVRRTWTDARLRGLRAWATALAGVYAVPLALWAILPDRAPSLTKDMHPAFVPLIVAVAAAYVVAWLADRAARR